MYYCMKIITINSVFFIPGTIDLLANIFVLEALGRCIPGISDVKRSRLLLAERSSFSLISCST